MEALEALGINLTSLALHTFNFLLLVALLTKFLYRPVTRLLDERSARIKESMEQAEAVKEQLARAAEETRLQLEAARKEGQAIVDQANQIAERVKAQARQEAQAEAERIVAKARTQLELEREQVIVELRREMADLVVSATGKIIGESLDDRAQRKLIEGFLQGNGQKLND
ncbi:MAG: F0F1 ATP synthase subunit B [Sphingomonadaceae bacterium]